MSGTDETVNQPKKRGRPKGKPLSAAERAQRRAAPVKHGLHASTAAGSMLPPCKPRGCPQEAAPDSSGYPCDLKKGVEAQGGSISACPLPMVDGRLVDSFRRAILEGDTTAVAELAASSLAGLAQFHGKELLALLGESLVIEQPIVGKGPDGPEIIGERIVANPRAAGLFQLSEMLGFTADAQVITPKSRGEKKVADSLERMSQADWIFGLRGGLGAALRGEGDGE